MNFSCIHFTPNFNTYNKNTKAGQTTAEVQSGAWRRPGAKLWCSKSPTDAASPNYNYININDFAV